MHIAERQAHLRSILSQRGFSNLDALATELGVSQSTIRRDLDQMEQEGQVRRTHGGVVWIDHKAGPVSRIYAFDHRMGYRLEAKKKIAEAARQLVEPGETILIDGGTTTFYLAQQLIGSSLQLVTNSLPIADLFQNDEQVELILTGGVLYPRYGVLLGPTAESVLQTIHARTMFFSVAGLHEGSVYNQNLLLVQSEQRMMQQSQQVVLLADSSKFGQQALTRLCDLSEIDVVVTDSELDQVHHDAIRAAGCQLIIAT